VITLSPEVKDLLGEHAGKGFAALDQSAKFLVVLNAKAVATGSALFSGVPFHVKTRRRAANRVARRSRRINRGA
jgi:hypothetical protein